MFLFISFLSRRCSEFPFTVNMFRADGTGARPWCRFLKIQKRSKIRKPFTMYPSIFGPSTDPDVGCKLFKLRKGECQSITFSLVVLRQIRLVIRLPLCSFFCKYVVDREVQFCSQPSEILNLKSSHTPRTVYFMQPWC